MVDISADAASVPLRFRDFCSSARSSPEHTNPVVTVANCPLDPQLPQLDYSDPVNDKRKNKNTFVTEAMLVLYALLMGQEVIGYANVNDGDVIQDIHPWDRLAHTQSQKALHSIGFHKDLANHFVRPDWVNILGLRQSPTNYVFTSYTRNIDVLDELTSEQRRILSRADFYTPFDDLTKDGQAVALGDAARHPVLGGASEWDIRLFENRTIGLTPQAQQALYAVVALLHKHKRRLRVMPGILMGEANNASIHCKEVIHFENEADLRNRWLQKTVNVRSLDLHARHMVPGSERIVNG